MSLSTKLLILTWVAIGLSISAGVGFYFGRATAPKTQGQYPPGIRSQDQMFQLVDPQSGPRGMTGIQPPIGGQQPPGGFQQPPPNTNQGGQQIPPPGGGQPLP
ncbi:hypothetical protein A2954_00875 [Candidatus Roizmanbacteria bacterium RIFCSPLOWO2_01_FULL_37_12]|uniref:Uncharacterized protein n=1 Tax=Candidatus Roizmanbacteria bacterium RIFCSPLOWO2_01_FULL_37_12 TaxID=1802056 RepID=A0A1F7IG83_9BACT|nr:MAG: hypothetical protein A2954_00875 [Candidatus Roizmanbacteria bacterium RIFCSPLOWO2_01_FULL_37_12]